MQINTEFQQELEESGYIHRPLPLHEEEAAVCEYNRSDRCLSMKKFLWNRGKRKRR